MDENSNNPLPSPPIEGILAEYNVLRAEILKRIEIRNSIVFGTLTFAGVLLGFGLSNAKLALIYPVISLFLAAAWVQNDVLISDLGRYIRDHLETSPIGLKWETHRQHTRVSKKRDWKQPSAALSSGGVFFITQLVAMIVAISQYSAFTELEYILLFIAVLCVLFTIYYFRYSAKRNI
jgi:hypothetical protein